MAEVADVTAEDSSDDVPELSPFAPDMSEVVDSDEVEDVVIEEIVEVNVEDVPVGS